mmetsp:Transcript_16781/g.33600  ORF Transcript_16781/g.33600 Transcript_16781/m.33600 type:complete len:135 (+) Transcript_16781:413-817(+)
MVAGGKRSIAFTGEANRAPQARPGARCPSGMTRQGVEVRWRRSGIPKCAAFNRKAHNIVADLLVDEVGKNRQRMAVFDFIHTRDERGQKSMRAYGGATGRGCRLLIKYQHEKSEALYQGSPRHARGPQDRDERD